MGSSAFLDEWRNVYCLFALLFSFQTLARLLFQAAKDGGYLDPHYIEEILGVSLSSLNTTPRQVRNTVRNGPQCTGMPLI